MAAYKITNIKTILQTNSKASGTVIFFHGSGDTGQGVREWIKFLLGKDISFPHLRILFPTAPLRPYTPMNGEPSHVWFDRLKISPDVPEHKPDLEIIGKEVSEIIKSEISHGISPDRIIVGGFSMGGALALHTAYRYYPQTKGVFALSSFLNNESEIYSHLKGKDGVKCPLLMFHGEKDELVPRQWAQTTFEKLKDLGVNGEFNLIKNTFHELKKHEIISLIEWINKTLPPTESDHQ